MQNNDITCSVDHKVKVPWGPPMSWLRRPFTSVLKKPCLQQDWPVIDNSDPNHPVAKWAKICVVDKCLLKAHHSYMLYKKKKQQHNSFHIYTEDEKKLLNIFEEEMSYANYEKCRTDFMNRWYQWIKTQKRHIGWDHVVAAN